MKGGDSGGMSEKMRHHNVPAGAVMAHHSPRGKRPTETEIHTQKKVPTEKSVGTFFILHIPNQYKQRTENRYKC